MHLVLNITATRRI